MGFLRKHIPALLLAALLLLPFRAGAEEVLELYEHKIKAGLVYNVLKYTTWPAESFASGDLRLCSYGDGPFDDYLAPLKGRTAQQHAISLVRVKTADEAKKCHLLFIHRNMMDELPALLPVLKSAGVLTVSDIEHFTAKGGMVELALLNQRVSLRINAKAVSSSGLMIQPRLMKLSTPG